mmetsp:Transcript_13208/g.46211  ORF Transcript_13208/g.46211 Transcript_13208/m.46211 type:complete len:303 (-) Transcript_13208:137-1045(-)
MARASAAAAVLLVAAAAAALTPAAAVRCVFLHGAGESDVGEPTDTDTGKYWGNSVTSMQDNWAPAACTSFVFNHDDTRTQRMDSANLKQRYCDAASGGTGTISDAIVFTHSMGNNILAAALRDGNCKIDHSSAVWYAASAPARGSKAANFAQHLCANNSTESEALRKAAELLHYCDPSDPHQASVAYQSLETTYPGMAGIAETMAREVGGAMCGDSDWGLTSEYSALFEALAALVKYGEANDGMVGIASCKLDGKTYSSDYTSDFYEASINHADGTCRDGNGDFGKSTRQPCKWFKSRKPVA